jgi:hypothetical protein
MSFEVVAKRTANVLVVDAVANPRLGAFLQSRIAREAAARGGLWVGGRVTLTGDGLAFHANSVNRALQTGSLDVEISLADIESIEVLPAFGTRIIAVTTSQQVTKIRCFRAKAFADQIRATAAAPRLG